MVEIFVLHQKQTKLLTFGIFMLKFICEKNELFYISFFNLFFVHLPKTSALRIERNLEFN